MKTSETTHNTGERQERNCWQGYRGALQWIEWVMVGVKVTGDWYWDSKWQKWLVTIKKPILEAITNRWHIYMEHKTFCNTHPVHGPPLVTADAYPDKTTNDGLGEYWQVDETLHLVAREPDLLQILSTRDKLRSRFSWAVAVFGPGGRNGECEQDTKQLEWTHHLWPSSLEHKSGIDRWQLIITYQICL